MAVRCDEMILRGKRGERLCGLDAEAYCADCERAVCSIHLEAKHPAHRVSAIQPSERAFRPR